MLENDILKDLEIKETVVKTKNTYSYDIRVIKKRSKLFSGVLFGFKYILTSSFIFAILLVTTNYSAYFNIIKSYIMHDELQAKSNGLLNSVEASNIKEKYSELALKEKDETEAQKEKETKLSIYQVKKEYENENIDLNIEITPYQNRVIIPKIGQNIPLVDVPNKNIEGENQLNDIFMKELEKGIVRYPGSAKPGQDGTSFIFGHSSNFPWIKGDYNDVFSTLDNVSYGDEIIVYYGQEKYKYKIREKKIITPGDVSVLKRDKDKSEITLMTCWPIGTTLNRLIVTGEIVEDGFNQKELTKNTIKNNNNL